MDTSVLADRTAYLADLTKRIQASWPEGLPLEPEYPFGQVSVPDYLRAWADRKGDEVAIDFYGRPLSWKDLNAYSDAFASFLDEKGVGVGDRVAVFLPNCPQFSIAFFGILKRGAILVPVNPMVKGRELAHYLEDSGARLVLAPSGSHRAPETLGRLLDAHGITILQATPTLVDALAATGARLAMTWLLPAVEAALD